MAEATRLGADSFRSLGFHLRQHHEILLAEQIQSSREFRAYRLAGAETQAPRHHHQMHLNFDARKDVPDAFSRTCPERTEGQFRSIRLVADAHPIGGQTGLAPPTTVGFSE